MKFEYSNDRFLIKIASSVQELAEIQKFRYGVFSRELEWSQHEGMDADFFDPFCDHLVVVDKARDRIAGSYRLMPGDRAAELQSFYCEGEFHLQGLPVPRARILELGRSCVHEDYRDGSVIQLLWMAISAYLDEGDFDLLMGAVSVPDSDEGLLDRITTYLARRAAAPFSYQVEVRERHRIPSARPTLLHYRNLSQEPDPEIARMLPPLLKGYLSLGAWVASPPAQDLAFGCFDFLVLLHRSEINPAYLRRFRKMREAEETVESKSGV